MRAFRVMRLFGRLQSLRQIINSLTSSIVPVMNAFLIMFLVMAIYAILGVSFFKELANDAFLFMFLVLAIYAILGVSF
ncbi:hypothetical protein T484DRAFT_1830971 [Baffinella frigidus]|nr:hypothetical protein T484DRAFT_1830971 [Cryptophyta sp. CCMP2293]